MVLHVDEEKTILKSTKLVALLRKMDNKHLLNEQKREKECWSYLLIAVASKFDIGFRSAPICFLALYFFPEDGGQRCPAYLSLP